MNTAANNFRQIGSDAFHAGQSAAPFLNADVVAAIADQPVGSKLTKQIMKDFSAGWHTANLTAQVA